MERLHGSEGNQCFGFKFFEDYKKIILNSLEQRFRNFTVADPMLSSWNHALLAFVHWLTDPRVVISNLAIDNLPPGFCPHLLHSCASGALFENGCSEWWKDLIPPPNEYSEPKQQKVKRERAPASFTPPTFLEAPRSFPEVILAAPLIISLEKLSVKHILESMQKEIDLLKQQGLHHSAFIQQHNDLDVEYLRMLSKLYEPSLNALSIDKRCSSSCDGVSIEFEVEKSIVQPEILRSLQTNRKHVQSLVILDLVDVRTALSGLRLSKILNWFIENKTATEIREEAVSLFYQALVLLDLNLQAYPPAEKILNLLIKEFGNCLDLIHRFTFYSWS